jgi:16S rRNA (guanine527-N7)-methyltransferase
MDQFIDQYLSLATTKYAGLNLTRILDREDFKFKQYLDSIYPLEASKNFKYDFDKAEYVVDVGFGGGFPLLPLAHLYKDKQFIGFEAREKKVLAVRDIAASMGINNVKVYHQRLEKILFDEECLILSKAVADVAKLLPLIATNAKLTVYFYKGPQFKENEEFRRIFNTWVLKEERLYEIENSSLSRYIVGFQNKNVPCGTNSRTEKERELFSSFI